MTHGRDVYRIVTPGLIGNVLEWYDFALYGYFAHQIAPLFFPHTEPMLSKIATFAVFAIGFLMRPIGAIVFGHYGDKFGRKNALAAAILLMAIPTTLIGCLPSIHTIGIAAPLLLILFRLLQGLAVGGEFTGSIVYIIEHAPQNRRGFFGSLAMSSAFVGLLIGSLSALVVYHYFPHVSYAWRVPFWFSLLLGAVGLYLRLGMPESPVFEAYQAKQRNKQSPLMEVLLGHKLSVLKAILLVMLPSAGFYLSFVYLPNYLEEHIKITLADALLANTLTMLVIIFCIPIFGMLSDKWGRKPILSIGALCFLCLSPLLYKLMQGGELPAIYLTLMCFAFMVACSYSVIPATLVEMFRTSSRYTGMSLPYNIANALFGGTAPLMATSLIHFTGSLLAPGIYLSLIALVTLLTSFLMRETFSAQLD